MKSEQWSVTCQVHSVCWPERPQVKVGESPGSESYGAQVWSCRREGAALGTHRRTGKGLEELSGSHRYHLDLVLFRVSGV